MSFVAQITSYAPPLTPMQMDVARAKGQPRIRGNLVFPGAQPIPAREARLEAFLKRQVELGLKAAEQAQRWVMIRFGCWDQLVRGPSGALRCPATFEADRSQGG
jgi:hypothetical protein